MSSEVETKNISVGDVEAVRYDNSFSFIEQVVKNNIRDNYKIRNEILYGTENGSGCDSGKALMSPFDNDTMQNNNYALSPVANVTFGYQNSNSETSEQPAEKQPSSTPTQTKSPTPTTTQPATQPTTQPVTQSMQTTQQNQPTVYEDTPPEFPKYVKPFIVSSTNLNTNTNVNTPSVQSVQSVQRVQSAQNSQNSPNSQMSNSQPVNFNDILITFVVALVLLLVMAAILQITWNSSVPILFPGCVSPIVEYKTAVCLLIVIYLLSLSLGLHTHYHFLK